MVKKKMHATLGSGPSLFGQLNFQLLLSNSAPLVNFCSAIRCRIPSESELFDFLDVARVHPELNPESSYATWTKFPDLAVLTVTNRAANYVNDCG